MCGFLSGTKYWWFWKDKKVNIKDELYIWLIDSYLFRDNEIESFNIEV